MANEIEDDVDVIALMRAKLPRYVVECFLLAGYDTIEVIAQMNTLEGSANNSIDQIESFILKNFPDDPTYRHTSSLTPSFIFVPGHRIRITQFVNEVKAKYTGISTVKGRKRKLISQESSVAMKKLKMDEQLLHSEHKDISESTGTRYTFTILRS